MNVRSRLAAALVVGYSLAACVVAHADSAPLRYGPKETLIKETSATGSKQQSTNGKSFAARQKRFFAAGPRDTVPVKSSREDAMLSHEH
jgi:hypothetical protein